MLINLNKTPSSKAGAIQIERIKLDIKVRNKAIEFCDKMLVILEDYEIMKQVLLFDATAINKQSQAELNKDGLWSYNHKRTIHGN